MTGLRSAVHVMEWLFFFRTLSFLWLVPSGYEAQILLLKFFIYLFLWAVPISIFFVVSFSCLFYLKR